MDFVKVTRRRSYKDRMRMLIDLMNGQQLKQVNLMDVVKRFQLTPDYCRKLMRWCAMTKNRVGFDENYCILYLHSELSPAYRRANTTQTKLMETI